MSNWNKISLYKFQQIDAINSRKDLSDIDKTLYSTCVVFDMTEYQLDNAGMNTVARMTSQVGKIFSSPLQSVAVKRLGRYFLNYNLESMRFGQYIEISHYLSGKPTVNDHKILASISNTWFGKNHSKDHQKKADYFLSQSVLKVVGCVALIRDRYQAFNEQYKSLFGLEADVHGETAQYDPFNKRYGWIYCASTIAEYERITLEEAYDIPIRQALHDLTYLKARGKYELEQFKKNNPTVKL